MQPLTIRFLEAYKDQLSPDVRAKQAVIGPAGTVEEIIEALARQIESSPTAADIAANRAEVERFVAGVLGLA